MPLFKGFEGQRLDPDHFILEDGVNQNALSKISEVSYAERVSTVNYAGTPNISTKTNKDIESKDFDDIEARQKRLDSFYKNSLESTKSKSGKDKDIEGILKEVKGTDVLVKLNCSEISGLPSITDDSIKVTGQIDVALSIEEGGSHPKLSFFVLKGVIDFSASESFSLKERTCCCINYSLGSMDLEYETQKKLSSQFSTLRVNESIIDAMCYSNENSLYKAKSIPNTSNSSGMGSCFDCSGCKCCSCCSCSCCSCSCCFDCCPVCDTLTTKNLTFNASDSREIGSHKVMPLNDTIKENGLKTDLTKQVDKEIVVVFYYRNILDNNIHKCTMKLSNDDYANAKSFVNLLAKYRATATEHPAIYAAPIGNFGRSSGDIFGSSFDLNLNGMDFTALNQNSSLGSDMKHDVVLYSCMLCQKLTVMGFSCVKKALCCRCCCC